MTEYLIVAVGVIFLTIIVSIIAPDGKLSKIINFVLRLICILALIQPTLQLFNFTDDATQLVNYDYISQVLAKSQSEQVEQLILEKFDVECECVIEIEYDSEALNQTLINLTFNSATDDKIIQEIYAYLGEIGYININVHEKTE
jgi:flagellar motor component MotA